MDSLAFLENPGKSKVPPLYVLHGDEDFLKRQVLVALRNLVFGQDAGDFGMSTYPGDKATFAGVFDELETSPLFGSRRLVVVENADPFVSLHRAALEKYLDRPSSTGVLVLDVKTWPATTRLYKLVSNAASITCKAPATYKLPEWCIQWASARHGKQLGMPAARLLVDLVGNEMGVLDQELAKLAIYAGSAKRIEAADVDQLVGSSSSANVFKIFDAIGAGQTAAALDILDSLFEQGEEPIRLLGAFSMQLRRLAQLSRMCRQGASLASALEEVAVPPWARGGIEQQLRHLGPRRTDRLYDWLLETDLGLKGSSQLRPRTLLERLVVRLAASRAA